MRFWNYIYYCTYRILVKTGWLLIYKPLMFIILKFFRVSKERKKRMDREFIKFADGKELGLNMSYAFSFMFLTTVTLFATICLYFTVLIDYKIKDDMIYFLVGVMSLSYLTNYTFLWRNEIYLEYFKEFEKRGFPKFHYLYVILFHLAIITLFIFSIYWFVGFNI